MPAMLHPVDSDAFICKLVRTAAISRITPDLSLKQPFKQDGVGIIWNYKTRFLENTTAGAQFMKCMDQIVSPFLYSNMLSGIIISTDYRKDGMQQYRTTSGHAGAHFVMLERAVLILWGVADVYSPLRGSKGLSTARNPYLAL